MVSRFRDYNFKITKIFFNSKARTVHTSESKADQNKYNTNVSRLEYFCELNIKEVCKKYIPFVIVTFNLIGNF